jgi:type VI secretion system protein ImpK
MLSRITKALRPSVVVPATTHPLVEAMYWSCLDLLTLASQLGQGATPSDAVDLQRHIAAMHAATDRRAREAAIPPEDVRDAIFAIFALLDEILVHVEWAGQDEWRANSLQFKHFQENSAGESFFHRVDVLLRQPHRAHVLLIYYYALALGFQGRYGIRGGQGLEPVYDAVAAALAPAMPPNDALSPHGSPTDGGRFLQREAPIVRASLGLLAVAVLLFLAMRLALVVKTSHAQDPMDDYARAAGVQ